MGICPRYHRALPSDTDCKGYPPYHILETIHNALDPDGKHGRLDCENHRPTPHERVVIARVLVKLTRSKYQRRVHGKVPRGVLCFTFLSLSQDPPPPTSVVVYCLSIVTVDPDCDVPGVITASSYEGYAHT